MALPNLKPTEDYSLETTTTREFYIYPGYSESSMISLRVCAVLGTAFLVIGILGFAFPALMSMHLASMHNWMHVLSGALTLWISMHFAPPAAKRFCLIFGSFYLLFGVLGFIAGHPGVSTLGYVDATRYLWTPIDRLIELGTADHVVHMIFGIVFIIAGFVKVKESPIRQKIISETQ